MELIALYGLYRLEPGASDIGLIKLETPLRLNKWVDKIALPKKDSEPSGQTILSGWGAIDGNEENPKNYPHILQTTKLPIISRKECNRAIAAIVPEAVENIVDDSNICTGPLTGGHSACSVSLFVWSVSKIRIDFEDKFFVNCFSVAGWFRWSIDCEEQERRSRAYRSSFVGYVSLRSTGCTHCLRQGFSLYWLDYGQDGHKLNCSINWWW